MANHHNILAENTLDDLLLNLIVTHNNNPEIQKSMDMTASYITGNAMTISVNSQTEQKFLNLANTSKIGGFLWKKYFIGFFVVAALSYSAWMLLLSKSPQNIQTPKASEMLVGQADSLRDQENLEIVKALPPSIIFNSKTDTLKYKPIKSSASITRSKSAPVINIPKQPASGNSRFYDEFDEEIAESVFGASDDIKVYPADFKMMGRSYNLIPYYHNYPKGTKPQKAFLPVYSGEPFKKGFAGYEFINIANMERTMRKYPKQKILVLPNGLEYYDDYYANQTHLAEFFSKNENTKYIHPFYIKKNEVSNLDYKEFLSWVKKYNGYEKLNLTGKDTNNEFPMAFRYTFHKKNMEVIKHFGSNSVNVYPKTDSWTQDFSRNFMEPMTKNYFSHPAYNHYPVVGVSYWQALAYTDWLTWMWQARMDKQGIPYEIEYDLPEAYEWEMAADKVAGEIRRGSNFGNAQEDNITNLAVAEVQDRAYRVSLGLFDNQVEEIKEFQSFFSYPVDMDVFPYKTSPSVNCLNSNVSEWIKLDYQKEWKSYSDRVNRKFANQKSPSSAIQIAMQTYFDSTCNSPKGKMVRGANWYDYRNKSYWKGTQAKAFINPDEQHSTVGFRFVIRVKLKTEAKAMDKIRILGKNLPKMDYSMEKKPEPTDKSNWYAGDPQGFLFIPMGTFNSHRKTISVQAFYAQETETTNFQWMLFLNDLIDNNRQEDLQECIPNDPNWAYKMTYETDSLSASWKKDFIANQTILFSKKFKKTNNIKDIPVTSFASKPIVGISHKAVQIFAIWLSKKYGPVNDFRLPFESEWEWMALGSKPSGTPFSWGGPYARSARGVFLANFMWSDLYYDLDTMSLSKMGDFYAQKYAENQNLEFAKVDASMRQYMPYPNLTTFVVGHFPPNDYGLYDICGNAAEMLYNLGVTKGGSWASPVWFIRIDQKEKWKGSPSNCVGFRLVQSYLGKNP